MISRKVVIVHLLIVGATPASAQPVEARAQVLYDDGRNLLATGKTAEACAAFEESQKLEPMVTTLIALATCRQRLGMLASAWELFLEAERQTQSATDNVIAQLHQIARTRASRLAPRVPRLTIHVPATSKIDGIQILRDKDNVPEASWNRALPVEGGTYTITARAPGTTPWSAHVTLASEADAKTIDVPDLRAMTMKREERSRTSTPHLRRGFLPLAVGVGAVALLGGALGFFQWGDSTYDDAKAELANKVRRDALYDSANRMRYTAQGLVGAGVGCAGVAIWLYLRQRNARAEPTVARTRGLVLTPITAGIGITGPF